MKKTSGNNFYFIDEHLSSLDPQDISAGPRILKIKEGASVPIPENADGPFLSIRNLKRTSARFKKYKAKNNKRSIKICEERWILEATNHGIITAPMNRNYPNQFIKAIEHATKGKIDKGKVVGVHFYDKKKVRLVEILNKNDLGAFEANFSILDLKTKLWYEKETPSTFFPMNWSLTRLFNECAYAYFDYQKEKIEGLENTYKAKTKSGVEVRIVIVDEMLKTMYPIL